MMRVNMRIGSIQLVAVFFLVIPMSFIGIGFSATGAEVVPRHAGVEFSVERGFYDTAFDLTLTTPTPAAQIRFTLDGSTPKSNTGIVYGSPFTIGGTTIIRAAAFKPNYQDPNVVTKTYIFVGDVIKQSIA